tara:strand:- start:988 stop:1899 length:912 start_codon:yes stop_codon:yes gene_type:complete
MKDCGDKMTQNNNIHTINNNLNTLKNNDNNPLNNNNTLINNTDDANNNNISYTTIDANIVKCNMCDKQLTLRSFHGHKSVCKRVPKNTCEYCKVLFSSQQSHSRHRKTCKYRNSATNNDEQHADLTSITTNNITTNNNNSNNTTNITTNNITNNNFNVFGKEELGYILENMETDPRIRQCLKSLVDTIELVHFNRDHPENHTIRKLNKKSELVEFRVNDNTDPTIERWVQESCATGIPKMQRNLELSLNTRFCDVPSLAIFKELLYHKTKQPTFASTECLLLDNGESPSSSNDKVHEMNQHVL